jgi:Zn-finger protein
MNIYLTRWPCVNFVLDEKCTFLYETHLPERQKTMCYCPSESWKQGETEDSNKKSEHGFYIILIVKV